MTYTTAHAFFFKCREFPCSPEGQRSGVVTAVVQVRSLVQELLCAMGTGKKKKRKFKLPLAFFWSLWPPFVALKSGRLHSEEERQRRVGGGEENISGALGSGYLETQQSWQ